MLKITIIIIFMYRSSKILLLLFIATSTYQQCAQTAQNDLLQSGNTFFFNANGGVGVREHIYQFPITYNVPAGSLKITASASSFQVYSNSGVNFQIISSAGPTTAFGVVSLLLGQDSSWNNVRVFYLVSSRKDFFLGTFSAGIYLLQKFSPGNSITLDYAIPGWANSQQSFTVIAQISGLRTSANSYTVGLGSVNFDSRSGELIIQVNLNSSPSSESISISYIIFQNLAPFAYSSFNTMSSSSATYQFIGISQLTSSSANYSGSGFFSQASTQGQISCIGSNCPSRCVTSQYCTAYRGHISGANCLLCGQGQVPVNDACQSIVPAQCGANQYFNGTDCVCFQGYIFVNSACYQACGTNAYIFNEQCQCIPGYSLSLVTYSCVKQNTPVCGQNFVLIKNVCTCKNGFGMINNLCLACPANSYVAPNGNCVCSHGLILKSSTLSCVSACYPNSYANSQGQCICNTGYYNTGNTCALQPNCVNGQIWVNNACVCPQGMVVDSITNQCTYCNTADRQVLNNNCVCSPSYYPTSVGCSSCPSNSVYNTTTASCACIQGYNMQTGVCVLAANCPLNSYWNQTTMRCDCTYFGDYVINGFCQQCPLNSKWNGTACACLSGLISTGTQCICPFGQFWSGTACVCGPNKYLVGNVCAYCDNNAVYNAEQKKCICKNGWYSVFDRCSQCDASCATCSGPSTNNCLTCLTETKLNNGVCGCNPNGQYLDASKICRSCMNKCVSCTSATTCTSCSSGYTPSLQISGSTVVVSCRLIPTGTSSVLTQRGQVTGNGVVYQGVGLSLMPTAILADGCKICDNLFKVQALSSFATITATTEYVADSQYWFVVTFGFGSASFISTFQFTIQIDQNYASYFSSADMAQKIVGTYSQTSTSTSANSQALPNPTFTTSGPNSSPPKSTSNSKPNSSPIARSSGIFGSTFPNESAKPDQSAKPSVTKDLTILASLFAA